MKLLNFVCCFRTRTTWKKILVSLIFLLLFAGILGCISTSNKSYNINAKNQGEQPQGQNVTTAKKPVAATVTRVIDGDTAVIAIGNGREEKVRFIGVDTPESTTQHEPYGKEASDYTKKHLNGKKVYLETDVDQRDKYGRLLAYIWLSPPTKTNDTEIRTKMFNAQLLLDGFAQVMTIQPNSKYADKFVSYQREARDADKGLWGIEPGNSASTPGNSTSTPDNSSAAPPVTSPAPTVSSDRQNLTVYVTNTGTKYHQDGCRYLKSSKIPMPLNDVKDKYGPCSICNPPQ